MSMRSSFIYGYGFTFDCKVERFIDFIKAHRETFCQSDAEIELFDKLVSVNIDDYEDDLWELWVDYNLDQYGYENEGEIVAGVMTRETDIRFIYCPADADCDTETSIVFESTYPWYMNETERNLTQRNLDEICKRYMDELGIAGCPDYLDLEDYG